MDPNDVLKGLKTRSFGRPLYCFGTTTSTNDLALELARAGATEGTTVAAEVQTKGRGRQGRKWLQVKGKGLAFSIVLWPDPSEAAGITLAAAVAVARTCEASGLRPEIKWPNDILLSGKKVCGILTETGDKGDNGSPVVLGVGINLNHSAKDFPADLRGIATSLYRAGGRKVDREKFFGRLLLELEGVYGWVADRKFPKVLLEWKKRAKCLGHQVKVQQGHHVFYGQVLDIDGTGALLVRNDHGMVEKVTSGDVTMLRIGGGK